MISLRNILPLASGKRGREVASATHPASAVAVEKSIGPEIRVSLLTGCADKPYALGLAPALAAAGVVVDFIGSDDIDGPELRKSGRIRFLNLRGSARSDASPFAKTGRVLRYYARLMLYAATAKPRVFHILWNNKFQLFDRTVLMLYYRVLGKKLVFTAHNVNAGKRDGNDSWLNRASLRIQYAVADHIFVHTKMMKEELMSEFKAPAAKVTVIPFGINNTVPTSGLNSLEARRRLGFDETHKVILFFGNIAPYKGLEYLVEAFGLLAKDNDNYRLVIAGKPKGCEDYWLQIQDAIIDSGAQQSILQRIEFIPDDQTELYFKGSDLLVLPYTHIFQSGVLFLGYSFGLPVIASDVGSLKEEIIDGETGFVCRPRDAVALAAAIEAYFQSALYDKLEDNRKFIHAYANTRHSWESIATTTAKLYSFVLGRNRPSAERDRQLRARAPEAEQTIQ